jgi:hypothetical protein
MMIWVPVDAGAQGTVSKPPTSVGAAGRYASKRRLFGGLLNPSHEQQDQANDQNDADEPDAAVTIPVAIPPKRPLNPPSKKICPGTSLKLAKGATSIGKYPEMMAHGITVALGTDGPSASGNLSLMRQRYLVAGLFKDALLDATQIGARRALRMATIDGARALLLESVQKSPRFTRHMQGMTSGRLPLWMLLSKQANSSRLSD